jgi:hypothetical protein
MRWPWIAFLAIMTVIVLFLISVPRFQQQELTLLRNQQSYLHEEHSYLIKRKIEKIATNSHSQLT